MKKIIIIFALLFFTTIKYLFFRVPCPLFLEKGKRSGGGSDKKILEHRDRNHFGHGTRNLAIGPSLTEWRLVWRRNNIINFLLPNSEERLGLKTSRTDLKKKTKN